jgi:hypothetical protein
MSNEFVQNVFIVHYRARGRIVARNVGFQNEIGASRNLPDTIKTNSGRFLKFRAVLYKVRKFKHGYAIYGWTKSVFALCEIYVFTLKHV